MTSQALVRGDTRFVRDCKLHNLTSPLLTMLLCQHMAFSSWLGYERKFPIAILRRAFSLEKDKEFGRGSEPPLQPLPATSPEAPRQAPPSQYVQRLEDRPRKIGGLASLPMPDDAIDV